MAETNDNYRKPEIENKHWNMPFLLQAYTFAWRFREAPLVVQALIEKHSTITTIHAN